MNAKKSTIIVLVTIAFVLGFGVSNFWNNIPEVYTEKYGLVQYFKDTFFSIQTIGEIEEIAVDENLPLEDKILVMELPVNFSEKQRLFEETIERLSSPLNNPIRAYKSKTFPLIFLYSQFDPIFGNFIDTPIERDGELTINNHTVSIYKKDSNLAMDQVIKSRSIGFDSKKCTIHFRLSEYNNTGMTIYVATDGDIEDSQLHWSEALTRDCGALAASKVWYVDSREELKDYYLEYPNGYQEPTGTVLTSDGQKVMWHETMSFLK